MSSDARNQVLTATAFKQKAELFLVMHSESEKALFQIATTSFNESKTQNGNWKFNGEVNHVTSQVGVRTQDMSGLVSLVYGGSELEKWLKNQALIHELKVWQGLIAGSNGSTRGGLMQSKTEVNYMKNKISEQQARFVTHFPTKYFNLHNASPELQSAVLGRRANDPENANATQGGASSMENHPEYLSSPEPSNLLQVVIEGNNGDRSLRKQFNLMIDPSHYRPLKTVMQ
ncbi:MAG: hypothetical protein ACFHVJ_20265 [Aestuariibacter sp.]